MKKSFEKKLYDKYPKLFKQKDLSAQQTGMCWGICCGSGWYNLLDKVCESIQNYIDPNPSIEQIEFVQIKEKFGGLRIYCNNSDDFIDGIIRMAENMSYVICEECGNKGELRQGGYISTSCDVCKT